MKCCSSGEVRLTDHVALLEEKVPAFDLLMMGDDKDSIHFRKNIHRYNDEMAFGSTCLERVCKN